MPTLGPTLCLPSAGGLPGIGRGADSNVVGGGEWSVHAACGVAESSANAGATVDAGSLRPNAVERSPMRFQGRKRATEGMKVPVIVDEEELLAATGGGI